MDVLPKRVAPKGDAFVSGQRSAVVKGRAGSSSEHLANSARNPARKLRVVLLLPQKKASPFGAYGTQVRAMNTPETN